MIDRLLDELTLAEKCAMLSGQGPFDVSGCDRLGIPGWRTSDGPIGVKGSNPGIGLVVPGESALAATWNTALVEEVGAALGDEAIDRHVDMVLGPTVNLHRSPLAGRHFECFSEDPELSAQMATAYIRGVQSRGVAACVKHFVGNDQEHERTTIDARIDGVTLREAYLRPFEAAVIDAGTWGLMAAYNFVNGDHATAHHSLLVDVLKGEWGFDGVVVSDWGAAKETVAPALHGLDVEMPGPGQWWGNGRLADAVERGEVPLDVVDDKLRRVLRLLERRHRLPGATVTDRELRRERPEHRAVVRRAAAEGMVLVKNGGVLPLAAGASVALIGPGAANTALLGGGSAWLEPYRSESLLDAFRERWAGPMTYVEAVDLRRRAPTVADAWIAGDDPGGAVLIELFDADDVDGDPVAVVHSASALNALSGDALPTGRAMSARATFTMIPDVSGPARLFAAAFGGCRLTVDGELVVDNARDQFSAGLGLSGSTGPIVLEAGRQYAMVLEVRRSAPDSWPIVYFDCGVAIMPVPDGLTPIEAAVTAAAGADVAVVVVGSSDEWEAESRDRESLRLPLDQDELVSAVAAANPNTVVVLNCGAPMELPWFDDVAAILLAWYPGQEGGQAILDVLAGDADPAGRMPTTWPRRIEDTPSFEWYPGVDDVVTYGEGLLLGHRWYDANAIDPLIPFGHGGSYTTLDWGTPSLAVAEDGAVVVEVPVTNTGDRSGSDVVQVYVAPPERSADRPVRTLAGFAKVTVRPGDTAIARVRIPQRRFARWDGAARRGGGWVVDPGDHELVVAASAVDLRSHLSHRLA